MSETSLQEHLMHQAELTELSHKELEAMKHLVGSLDGRGFLTQTAADISVQTSIPLEAVEAALKVMKTFDPPGIGASNLADCLLAQLVAKGRNSSLASRMIRDHFDLLTRRRVPELGRKLGADDDDVQSAIVEIGRLDPAPGRR